MELVQFNAVGRLANEYFGIGFVYMVCFQYDSILAAWAAVTCVTTTYTSVPPHKDGRSRRMSLSFASSIFAPVACPIAALYPRVVIPPTVTLNCQRQGVAPHRSRLAA